MFLAETDSLDPGITNIFVLFVKHLVNFAIHYEIDH